MDSDILDKIINHTHYSKEVIIDYNDFIDTRGVPSEIVPLVKKYTTINCKPTGGYWGPLGGKKFTLIE